MNGVKAFFIYDFLGDFELVLKAKEWHYSDFHFSVPEQMPSGHLDRLKIKAKIGLKMVRRIVNDNTN